MSAEETGHPAPVSAYDIFVQVDGQPTAAQVIARVVLPRTLRFGVNLVGTRAYCGTNPTASATFTLKHDGVSFGTIAFATDGTATMTAAASTTLVAGDLLTLEAPDPQDATLADLAFTLAGVSP